MYLERGSRVALVRLGGHGDKCRGLSCSVIPVPEERSQKCVYIVSGIILPSEWKRVVFFNVDIRMWTYIR